MNLYEIENKILSCIDEETGEILNENLLDDLVMEKNKKIENIALYIKNLNAEIEAINNEVETFKKRKEKAQNKVNSLTNYLNGILKNNFKTSKVEIKFRKSESVSIKDGHLFVEWAKQNKPLLLSYKQPTPNKTEIKMAIKNGEVIEFAEIVENRSINIK